MARLRGAALQGTEEPQPGRVVLFNICEIWINSGVYVMQPVRLLVVVLVLVLVPAVSAASGHSSYGYWGIDLLGTKITEGADAFGDDFDDESGGVRFYGGYRVNEWVGVEAGLHDLGRFRQGDFRASYNALVISGMLYAPVSRSVDLFGRVGGGVARLDERDDGFSVFTRKPIGKAGVGVQIHVNPHLLVRGGVDVYALEPQVRGPGGSEGERTSQRIGAGYLGLNFLF